MKYTGIALILAGIASLVLNIMNLLPFSGGLALTMVIGLPMMGAFLIFANRALARPAGIDNDHIFQNANTNRGWIAFVVGIFVTGMYLIIYFGDKMHIQWSGYPTVHHFFQAHVYSMFDSLSEGLRGKGVKADNWFFYSAIYTVAVLLFGARMLMKYRHNRYQQIRSMSVMFVQLAFGFLIPAVLAALKEGGKGPEYYFSYFWPLKPEYLYPSTFQYGKLASNPGVYFLGFGLFMTFVGTPALTYFFGKRWYCSWVCGCGGLAETAGDPYRQLSDKSLKAWKIERWIIHGVLVAVIGVTAALWIDHLTNKAVFGGHSSDVRQMYGFYIGLIFSGVVGTGFYPLMGNRVWCRFGCPMAAILGIFQKFFSRFRITTNGAQCISCGNCSTYCEMGIDVRWYAQRGENIVRASCVGCGVCSAVCPRGVLKLENGGGPGPRTEKYFLADLVEGRSKIDAFN